MLKTSGSTESTIRSGKGKVEVGGDGNGDGGKTLTSRLRTSSSTDSSTSAAQIVVEFDRVDASGDAVGKKSKNCQKIRKNLKRPEKFIKAIGLEERLPKHRFLVN